MQAAGWSVMVSHRSGETEDGRPDWDEHTVDRQKFALVAGQLRGRGIVGAEEYHYLKTGIKEKKDSQDARNTTRRRGLRRAP